MTFFKNEFGCKSAILQTFSKYVEAMNIGMYLVQSNYFLSKIKLIANPMSSSLKMQLACIKLKLVKIMKRQLHIIHSSLNPFHNDRGTVNDQIHSG